jgi:prepilin-type N-terminal cleavage/methylation domain-containing protein
MKTSMTKRHIRVRSRGFSLLELMIVVVLLAGITAIAWPSIARPMRKAELSEATQKLREAIEDGRYQAMMSGEPVFLQITEGNSHLRSGGIAALMNGELDEDSEPSVSTPQDTRPIANSLIKPSNPIGSASASKASSTKASGGKGLGLEQYQPSSAVMARVWKLPDNIIVSSVQWTDEESDQQSDEAAEDIYAESPGTVDGKGNGSIVSGGLDALQQSEGSDPAISGIQEKWCLPMSAQGRGRDAEITLLDKRARQTVTVSFTAATGELEVVR